MTSNIYFRPEERRFAVPGRVGELTKELRSAYWFTDFEEKFSADDIAANPAPSRDLDEL